MKLLYTHPNFSQVALMSSFLETEDVHFSILNEHLSTLAGGIPSLEAWPEIWVKEEDLERAQELIAHAQSQTIEEIEQANWICPQCGSENEGNIALCWNCDYAIDGAETPEGMAASDDTANL